MEATAKVIPWNSKASAAPSAAGSEQDASGTGDARFGPLEGVVVMIPDEQLDALGSIFAASPLRGAMTFEGYLVVKGFGQLAS